MKVTCKEQAKECAEGLACVFDSYRKPNNPAIDKYDLAGRTALVNRMADRVLRDETISFVLPGFPAKSPNVRDKVLGTLPDAAEEVAFQTIGRFLDQLGTVYSRDKVRFNVISDGAVFGDIVGVPPQTLADYESVAREMVSSHPIRWHTLSDFYPRGTQAEKLAQLIGEHGITEDELDRRIHERPDITMLFNGMHVFMQHDIIWPNDMSKSQMKKKARDVARQMMFRNEAYSGLIDGAFKDAVRLSIHPSTNYGHKFSFQLVPGNESWASPWHNALLVKTDGSHILVKKKDAVEAGHVIVEKGGRPYHIEEKSTRPLYI